MARILIHFHIYIIITRKNIIFIRQFFWIIIEYFNSKINFFFNFKIKYWNFNDYSLKLLRILKLFLSYHQWCGSSSSGTVEPMNVWNRYGTGTGKIEKAVPELELEPAKFWNFRITGYHLNINISFLDTYLMQHYLISF